MNIVVISGEGAINDVRLRQGNDIAVQVRDGNRRPLAGVKVVFELAKNSPAGQFADGKRAYAMTTDEGGRATARFTPDNATGTVTIDVSAESGGETATTSITQFNMYVPQAKGGSGKWVALLAVIGAAAAGGAVAALRKDNGRTTAPPPTPIGISPGAGTVGPPR